MARLVPDFSLFNPHPGIKPQERATLELLEQELSDQFQVFHNIHWTTQTNDSTLLGEIDFIVLAPTGRLLLIEQKNGLLNESTSGLTKTYALGPKPVVGQISRNASNLLEAFEARTGKKPDLDFLLYCPDYEVQNKAIAGMAANRIIDRPLAPHLPRLIEDILYERGPNKDACKDHQLIEGFLSSALHVRYDIGYLGKVAKSAYIQQAAGLSEWVGKLSGDPFKLVVEATAGSGKTQLCLDEIHDATEAAKAVLYVCFNRSLAEDMKRETGLPHVCTTYHELARHFYEALGNHFDAEEKDIFTTIGDFFAQNASQLPAEFDVLLIDEGQDFEATWIDALQGLVKDQGRVLLMQDSNQTLYERGKHSYKGWMKLTHPVTYRCPRTVTDLINELGLCPQGMVSQCQIEGIEPVLETYDEQSEQSLLDATTKVVNKLLKDGHPPEDIAVLTVRGANSSRLLQEQTLAGQPVRKIVGRDDNGQFIWSEGSLTCDTVFRFKGRSANCIVLTEVDFEEIDDNLARRLFVGLSRARLGVGLVISSRGL